MAYSVLMPGARSLEPGAVVQYAIVGEKCRIGRFDGRVGSAAGERGGPRQAGGIARAGARRTSREPRAEVVPAEGDAGPASRKEVASMKGMHGIIFSYEKQAQ